LYLEETINLHPPHNIRTLSISEIHSTLLSDKHPEVLEDLVDQETLKD